MHSKSQGVPLLAWYDFGYQGTWMSCPVCAQYVSQTPREPMFSHDIPYRPWSLISQDILMWEGKWYLVTTCHYSDWLEIDILPNTLTATVVELTKAHFARFGVPYRMVSDKGPSSSALSTSNLSLSMGLSA